MKKTLLLLCILSSATVLAQGQQRCGTVEKNAGRDIIVRYDAADKPFAVGERLHAGSGSEAVELDVIFPMQTLAKCRPVSRQKAAKLKKGTIVYRGKLSEPVSPAPDSSASGSSAAQPGVPPKEPEPRFVDNGDGTITDNDSGLMWIRNASAIKGGDWLTAYYACESFQFAGYNDWHLPTQNELQSLVSNLEGKGTHREKLTAAGFTGIQLYYWTSTSGIRSNSAHNLYTDYSGSLGTADKTKSSEGAWAVRAGMKQPFKDNGNGTLTDRRTGLVWLKNGNIAKKSMSWDDAVSFCRSLRAAGLSGWRMPTKEELEQLMKYYPTGYDCRSIFSRQGFTETQKSYWSSSTDENNTANAWHVSTDYGSITSFEKSYAGIHVLPVRAGR